MTIGLSSLYSNSLYFLDNGNPFVEIQGTELISTQTKRNIITYDFKINSFKNKLEYTSVKPYNEISKKICNLSYRWKDKLQI